MKQSLFRKLTHQSLAKLMISGTILDVGGDYRSLYRICLGGQHKFITLNIDEQTKPDLKHLARRLGRKYTGTEYPLGYLVVARRSKQSLC